MTDFYVTLPSSVPNPQFKNTSSRYITRLPEVLNLERDKYVVAATDIIYPYSYINVGKPLDYWIHFKSDRLPIRVTFPPSQYSDATQIVNTLNDRQTTRLKRSSAISFVEKELSRVKRSKKEDVVKEFESLPKKNGNIIEEFESLPKKNDNIIEEFESLPKKNDNIIEEFESLQKKNGNIIEEFESLQKKNGNIIAEFESLPKKNTDVIEEFESIPKKDNVKVPPDVTVTQQQPPGAPLIFRPTPPQTLSQLLPQKPSPPVIITRKNIQKEEKFTPIKTPSNQSMVMSLEQEPPIVKEAPILPSNVIVNNIVAEYQMLEEAAKEHIDALSEYAKINIDVLNKSTDETIYADTLEKFRKIRSKLRVETASSSKEFLQFNDIGDQLEIQFLDDDISFVEFDEPCAYFLGFVDPIIRKTQKAPKKIDYFGNVSTIYLYCDVIDPIIVGNTKSALLSVIPCRGAYGEMIHYTVTHPRYLPLIKSTIDSIRVDLLTEFSEPIDFNWGSTIIVLHFKRI
ncbi:hypothetical protein CAEBREN_08223 [Caenorhabditis brenneri]|uniref:Uncharacterized protein n=1 Tax=Caenorhabditis brenneri TaxID=135651 RepID=G0N1A2_CAEBE|nr:hypothetical protein CAEBREN_08223 [Caenorhabditis brenneri]